MSAEVLRQAAALMRERAADADSVRGPGAWHIETAWCDLTESSYAVKSPGGAVVHGSCEEEAAHIASWHPAVALAVADWLDDEAEEVENASRICIRGLEGLDVTDENALAVARAYLVVER